MSEILGLYLCCLNSTIESRLNPVSLSPFYKSLFQGLGAVNAELDLTLVLILISFEICCLVGQSCPTLYKPMDGSTPCFPFLHHLPELAQTHVHWVGDAIQPSRLLLSPSPPAFNLSHFQGLFQWISASHQVAWKYIVIIPNLRTKRGDPEVVLRQKRDYKKSSLMKILYHICEKWFHLRKPELKETCVPECSSQHCL